MKNRQNKLIALLIIAFALLLFLPWAGIPFYTKGEPREALVAQQMEETGNYILPTRYGDDIATKPPMTHWLMSAFSLPNGQVNELTSRLPSTFAGILIVAYFFLFIAKRSNTRLALLTSIVLLGCFEWFRAVPSARVDMPLTAFLIAALLQMHCWEERSLKGFPIWAVLFMSLATLVKGPVGIVLPCFIFFVYLLLQRHNFWRTCLALIEISLPALVLPAVWYWLAIRQGGNEFLAILIDENFARFTGKMTIGGTHVNSIWYMFGVFFAGLAPWILLALLSLFHIKKCKNANKQTLSQSIKLTWNNFLSMKKLEQFALVAALCIITFYAIPESKRSVYLLPAFPFVSLFLAKLMLWLADNKKNALKIFSWFIFALGTIAVIAIIGAACGIARKNFYIDLLGHVFSTRGIIAYIIVAAMVAALIYQAIQQTKLKKYLMPTIITYFSLLLFFNAVYHPTMAEARTLKYFAAQAKQETGNQNIYAYEEKMYCLNYELHNKLKNNFDEEKPTSAYVVVSERQRQNFIDKYKDTYSIKQISASPNKYNEMRRIVYLIKVNAK